MQNATKRWPAVVCALVIICLIIMWIGILAAALLGDPVGNLSFAVIIGIYATLAAAVVVGILIALWQRMKEISGGEEEEAKKY